MGVGKIMSFPGQPGEAGPSQEILQNRMIQTMRQTSILSHVWLFLTAVVALLERTFLHLVKVELYRRDRERFYKDKPLANAKTLSEFEIQFKRFLDVSLWGTDEGKRCSRYQLNTQCQTFKSFCFNHQDSGLLKNVEHFLERQWDKVLPEQKLAVEQALLYISNYL